MEPLQPLKDNTPETEAEKNTLIAIVQEQYPTMAYHEARHLLECFKYNLKPAMHYNDGLGYSRKRKGQS